MLRAAPRANRGLNTCSFARQCWEGSLARLECVAVRGNFSQTTFVSSEPVERCHGGLDRVQGWPGVASHG